MNNQRRGSNPNEIGAAWIKEGQQGEYISIQLKSEAANFDLANCFIDMYWIANKRSDKAPDYRIVAKPKTRQSQGPRQQPQRSQMPRPGSNRPQRQAPPVQSEPPWDDGDGDPGY